MAITAFLLTFEGPPELVRPDRTDARPLLEVLLRFVHLLEAVGAHDVPDTDEAPFVVVMKELRAGSIKHVLDFVPREGTKGGEPAARRAGLDAAEQAVKYLERPNVGPPTIRKAAKALATAIMRLPAPVTAHLRGKVDARLSKVVAAEAADTSVGVESFRATILRAGGHRPRVQLGIPGSARPVTLDAPHELAVLAGQTLYSEADVTATLERSAGGVLHGTLSELRVLDEGDAVDAFDRWYTKAGRPWSKVKDIERGLGRGNG